MSKLFWVLLPLLLVVAGFALQAWRRRPPSRRTINMVASLLLLGYIAATAGLGIFWVANQQLPVFDWHYLFGYATVLLVGLHLAFNFGAAWRHLWRSRSAGEARRSALGDSDPAVTRRGSLQIAGVALLAGLAFVLGLRHGRQRPARGGGPCLAGRRGRAGRCGGPRLAGGALSRALLALASWRAVACTRCGLG